MKLPPAHRIQVAEQADGIVIPDPPQVTRQRPQPFLHRRDESIQSPGFADDRRNLGRRLRQHPDFVGVKDASLDGLNHQDALQNAAVDHREAEERLIRIFTRLVKILEARMVLHLIHRDSADLFCNQPGQTLVKRQAQRADTFFTKSERGG